MLENIDSIINKINPNLNETFKYYLRLFLYGLSSINVLPDDITIEDVAHTILNNYDQILFYDIDKNIDDKLGIDIKSYSDISKRTIYIRNRVESYLQEIAIFKELTKAAQTNSDLKVGINKGTFYGKLIVEAESQLCAEKIYSYISNYSFDDKLIPTEHARMNKGGTIVSNLHDSELYDAMLTKLAIIMEEPKDYFITINFLNEFLDSMMMTQGVYELKKKYDQVKRKRELPFTLEEIMWMFDYIYAVDYYSAVECNDKNDVAKGELSKETYRIHGNGRKTHLSKDAQMTFVNRFDMELLKSVKFNKIIRKRFSKYIVKNDLRFFAEHML